MSEFPRQIAALYALLHSGEEVSFEAMIAALGVAVDKNHQQYLGSYINRLNRRLKKEKKRVVPGRMKRTYVLRDA